MVDNIEIKETAIKNLFVKKLIKIEDDRGGVFKFTARNSPEYKNFGEVYFSKIYKDVVKGWKYHKEVNQFFCVPFGEVKFVIYDSRKESKTYGETVEIILDDSQNYNGLIMPPKLWYSFKGISNPFSIISNVIDLIHDPNESNTVPLKNNVIPYEW